MHITNFNDRFDGRLHYNTGRRINNGLIRNGHNVLALSDRDIIHTNKKFNDLSGNSSLQTKIINSFNNFKPDLIILGHAYRVSNNTLEKLKNTSRDEKKRFLNKFLKGFPRIKAKEIYSYYYSQYFKSFL